MPVLFHGTDRTFALAMAGSSALGGIDVTIGRGEFGRGYYAQNSIGNAARRGQALYGDSGVVLVLDVSDRAYYSLKFRRLTLTMAQRLNARLRRKNAQHTYGTAHDVIVGPLVSQPKIEQHKFQTAAAAEVLNGAGTVRTVQ